MAQQDVSEEAIEDGAEDDADEQTLTEDGQGLAISNVATT